MRWGRSRGIAILRCRGRGFMPYYSERNGMRRQTAGTYEVSVDRYSLLFRCCEKYYNNLA